MWPSTLIEIGGMSKINPFVILMQFGENYAYKHADAVVSLPKYAKSYMIKHGLRENKFFHISNGVIKEEWDNPESLPNQHETLLKALRNDNKFIVGYFGGHALSNCLMTLIQSAGQMQDENVHFVLVGNGVEKERLINASKAFNNVTFLPPVNKKAIPTLTNFFDCVYIGAKDSPLYRFGVCMNKMFDGMMAEKPIIFAINAQITPVEECNCGFVVPPEISRAIVEAIQKLMKMKPDERMSMGQRGRIEVLKNYTYDKLAKCFIDVMKG